LLGFLAITHLLAFVGVPLVGHGPGCGRQQQQCQPDRLERRKKRLIEVNSKCRHLKMLTCKGTLLHVFISLRLRTPSPPLHTVCKRV
jgi:hypothetical protein